MKKYLLVLFLVMIGFQISLSKNVPKVLDKNNKQIKEIAQNVDNAGWVYFKKEQKLAPDDIFYKFKDAFGISKFDKMIKVKTKTDVFGLKHSKYQQYYKGILVEHFTYLVHEKDGIAEIANGELLENIDLDITPLLSPEKSFEIALNSFKSNKWAWEDKDWEEEKKANKINPSWKPRGDLMIIDRIVEDKKVGVLVYKFDMFSLDPYFQYSIYINSNNGNVEKKVSLFQSVEGTVNTLYNGTKSITTLYRGLPNWDYILEDKTRGYICTKIYNGWTWNLRGHIDNHENSWHNEGTEVQGASCQWAAERTYDYFQNAYNRNGINGNNVDLRIQIYPSYTKTGWTAGDSDFDLITVGTIGQYFNATLDIIGHEYTHGVIASEAGLIDEKESGALNESFADIFGTMVERFAENSTWNWTLGEDIFDNDYLRSMSDPHSKSHASTYLTDSNWFDVTNCSSIEQNDYCGIYTNAGVQNYWFYLLSTGGTQNGVTVDRIGPDKAAQIAYYSICYCLTEQSGYLAARSGSISAASSLYGACSNECKQVKNAWAAVGIGSVGNNCISATISGPNYIYSGDTGTWTPIVSGGSGNFTYTWSIGGSTVSNDYTYEMTFDNEEMTEYTLGLMVEDEYFSDYDEIIFTVCPHQDMKTSSGSAIKLYVYPNPTSDFATLQVIENEPSPSLSKDDNILVLIVDKNGRELYKSISKTRTIQINTSNLQTGVYSIITSLRNNKASTNLVIKR